MGEWLGLKLGVHIIHFCVIYCVIPILFYNHDCVASKVEHRSYTYTIDTPPTFLSVRKRSPTMFHEIHL